MISHRHRCIFVHIPKCGGQSVEQAFLSDLGLTWEERAPLLLRRRAEGEGGPPRLAHLTASDYVALGYVTQGVFDRYLKLAVVRSPFDRAGSLYQYTGYSRMMPLERFATEHLPEMAGDPEQKEHWFVRPQSDFVTGDDGEVLVDALVHLERIDAELAPILRKLGLPESIPHVNRSTRLSTSQAARVRVAFLLRRRRLPRLAGEYPAEWTDDARAALVEVYGRDFELLGYPT
jgi:hypothetical protein